MEAITRCAFGRLGTQTPQLAVAKIDPVHFPALTLGIKRVVIRRIEQNVKSISAGERNPVCVTNTLFALHAARSNPVLVVLQSAGDPEIRLRIVQTDPIKLARREFVQVVPIFSAGKTLIKTAVR